MTLRVLMIHEDRRGYGQGGGAETILRENTNVLRGMGHDVRWYHGGESFTDLLAAYRPDVCHVYTVHNFMGFGEVKHLQRVGWPHVWQLMDYWPFCGGRMLLRRYDETCSAATGLCDGECREGRAPDLYREVVNGSPIAALCPDTAAIYRRHGVRCDYVLSPGVDADFFTPAPDRRVAGRVVTSSAWPQYPTKGMHILRAAAREVGVAAHLITGQPRERVRDLLQTGDVFVFPSTYEETYGLCLTEAMSTGLACIASSVCGTRAQVTDGVDGLLVPPRDAGALADALRRLLTDAALRARMGRAARETVERDRTLAHVGERLMAVYREVLDGRS